MRDYKYIANCNAVVDGDTIAAVCDLGFSIYTSLRFRLNRINTPELNSKVVEERAKAKAAKEYVEQKILGRNIVIESHKTEKYGRYLAEVFYTDANGKEINLNDELLANGLADKYE